MRTAITAFSIALATAFGIAGCASSPETKRTVGQTSEDVALTAKVKTAIATDVGARAAASINVETYKGVVQLSGFVDSQDMANRALAAAKKVGGVQNLKNDLRLKSS